MSAPHLRAVADRPLFDVENDVRSLVDRLTLLDAFFSDNSNAALTEGLARAIGRQIGDAVNEAGNIERSWNAEYGRQS